MTVSASKWPPRNVICLPTRPGAAAKIVSRFAEPVMTKKPEDAEQEAEVTDAVDDERLDGGRVRRRLLEPEANEQIGGDADALPAEEHLHQIVRRHERQHGEGEEGQVGEEARPVRIVAHVADRVDMHQGRDGVDDDQHDGGQRVDADRPVDRQRARMNERQHRHLDDARAAKADLQEHAPGQKHRRDHQARRHEHRDLRRRRRVVVTMIVVAVAMVIMAMRVVAMTMTVVAMGVAAAGGAERRRRMAGDRQGAGDEEADQGQEDDERYHGSAFSPSSR